MGLDETCVGSLAIGFDGCDRERSPWHSGTAVGYMAHPTVIIETPHGQVHWAAHLCRSMTEDEKTAYWRKRAEAAEAKLQRSIAAQPEREDR